MKMMKQRKKILKCAYVLLKFSNFKLFFEYRFH